MAEVWFRNPHNYIREVLEAGAKNVIWDMGILVKRGVDPYKHAKLYYGAVDQTWRAILVGTQGSPEIGPNNNVSNPIGVYPTWEYGEKFELLEEMIAEPVGENPDFYDDTSIPVQERPVKGQSHRVIVTELPSVGQGPGKNIVRKIAELQEEYPSCIVHIHGLYSYRVAFGMGFGAADMDARTKASKGAIILPNGKEMIAEKAIGAPQWITLLGMRPVDLKDPRNRCIYNVKSALWAAENWDSNIKFKSTPNSQPVDPDDPNGKPETANARLSLPLTPRPGDLQLCNTCSLQERCKFFRDGAVCSVPGSEPASLATMFKSRDSGKIIDALGTLLAANTRRLEAGLREEQEYGELSSEVTKISNQLFAQGVSLAKLIDPNLRGGAKVQVNVGGNAQVISGASPNAIMGSIVRELESRGIPREAITPEMVQGLLAQMANGEDQHKAIEGTVLGTKDD